MTAPHNPVRHARLILALLLSLFLLALGIAWRGFRVVRQTESTLVALAGQRSRLNADVLRLRQLAGEQERQKANIAVQIARAGQRASRNSATSGAKDAATLLATDPKLMSLFLKSWRANLRQRFSAMYQAFGLSQAQIDKFEDLATAHEADIMDLQAAALSQGLTLADPDVAAMRSQKGAQYRAAVFADVGVAAAKGLSLGSPPDAAAQNVVETLAESMALSPEPLTSDQAALLTPIIFNASSTPPNGGSIDIGTVNWEQAIAQSKALLTESQIQNLENQKQHSALVGMLKQFYSQQPKAK
jgi:hypothetical protein